VSSGSKVFDALLLRKSAELAEAFIESDDLLVVFDNQNVPRHAVSWERGRFSGVLFRGNWRVGCGLI
jgi:hypothetical protein